MKSRLDKYFREVEAAKPPPPVAHGDGGGEPDSDPTPTEVPSLGCLKAMTIIFVAAMVCQVVLKIASAYLGHSIN